MTMSRYYPGFLAALSIVLLRIAIGWHFLYEGWDKFEGTITGKEPFSAEIYLRNATGPLAPYYRGLIPDVNGLALLDPGRLKTAWSQEVARLADAYGFTQEQRSQSEKILEEYSHWADSWFMDTENAEKRAKYFHDLREVQLVEWNPEALAFERERAHDARASLDTERRQLTGPLIARAKSLREAVAGRATPDQLKTAVPLSAPWTSLDVLNLVTIYALIAIGFCLMAGFLTPWAALGAAAFLAMIYLSMPPWPGLPANPRAEGHYWIISKNSVELLACLVIASTPSGYWVGFDALFFGARRRRKLAQALQNQQRRGDPPQARAREREPIPIV